MKLNLAKGIATVGGAGFFPVAPGTMGAIVGLLTYYLLYLLLGNQWALFQWVLLALCIVVGLAGVWASNVMEEHWGKDASKIVVDELIGQWLTLLWIPFSWQNVLFALIFFRFFDILKPLFIRKMEALPRGWGVMMDDVLSGVYANIVLQIIVRFV